MSVVSLRRIGTLIREQQHILLARWRRQVRQLPSAKGLDVPSLNDHMPVLIDELATALENEPADFAEDILVHGSPPVHGRQRLQAGFNLEEVVAEYNVLRGCIHDLAEEHGLIIHGNDLRVVNRIVDEAVALAVQSYATRLSLEIKKHRDQHIAFVANDLRTPLQAISLTVGLIEEMHGGSKDDVEVQKLLQLLRRNIQQLEKSVVDVIKSIDDELPSEVVTPIERRTLDLWPLVESVLAELQPVVAASSVEISNKIPLDLQAYADASLLRHAFEDIFVALMNGTPRSHIVVDGNELASGGIRCRVLHDGTLLEQGKSDEVRKVTTPAEMLSAPGTSTDLAVVRQIIDAHGGNLSIKKNNGVVAIEFTLPPVDRQPA